MITPPTNDIWFLTMSSIPRRPAPMNNLKPSPFPSAMFCPSAGCAPKRLTRKKIPSGFITFQWNFSSAVRWATTSPTCCSTPMCDRRSKSGTWTGWHCSNRNRMPAWATAGSAVSRRAFWIHWPRCRFRRWATACVMNMEYSSSPSRTAGSRNSPTTGCVVRIRGKSCVRKSKWR